jgi:hypothetical protein
LHSGVFLLHITQPSAFRCGKAAIRPRQSTIRPLNMQLERISAIMQTSKS